ncbi:MAG: hypothetical protein HQL57_01830 [Magnetococcales bacterium]|nr:hypothetical protein [Magnetococcales bacterium]MBF0155910.1 hypothetical protein [Magnetococcales bacterium]
MAKAAKGWVPLQEYLVEGLRAAASRGGQGATESLGMPPPPPGWVPLADYMIDGVRHRLEPLPETAYFERLVAPPEPPPPQPERDLTMYRALAEVYAMVTRQGAVRRRLDRFLAESRAQCASGRIRPESLRKIEENIAAIQAKHLERLESVAEYFLARYFRIYDNPEPVVTGGGKY